MRINFRRMNHDTPTAHADTIFALASAHGQSGVAVIRVSGTRAFESAKVIGIKKLQPQHSHLVRLYNPTTGEPIDHALTLPFRAPASFTGEDVVEYHLHGGRAVINALLEALAHCDGHRMAEPGEFTRRAFENNKLDLTEAEAVADLIHAETAAQKNQALSQLGGSLSALYNQWGEQLKRALAHLEADIEFPDEDMPDGIAPSILATINDLYQSLNAHLSDSRKGERLRDGLQVTIIGAPNAGKSSLLNVMAQRDIAIVSDMAGTTRDIIEAHLDIAGFPVILSDTAGLRPDQIGQQGHDAVESEGIKRAIQRAKEADIKILMFDAQQGQPDIHTLELIDDRSLIVINKCDQSVSPILSIKDALYISIKDNIGFPDLLKALEVKIIAMMDIKSDTPSLTRQRHRFAIEEARDALNRALNAPLPELVAEDMRLAIRSLGRIVGRVDVEDLLDVIFKDFCIGK